MQQRGPAHHVPAKHFSSAGEASREAASADSPLTAGAVVKPPLEVGGAVRAGSGVRGVADTLLHLVQDALRQRAEDILDILASQGAGLQKQDVLLLGEPARLQEGNLPLLLEVLLVADGYDGDVLPGLLSGVLEPRGEVVVRVARGDIIQDECPDSATVVRACHCTVALLTRRVPDLELDLAVPQGYDLGAKLHADGVRRLLPELALHELLHEAALARAGVPNDDQLEAVVALRALVLVLLVVVNLDEVAQLHG
mmetsp:Transcript_13577/g.42047  ORF Transcript_13577/g.42047 Transcript_13577/m.42047 type:complete len:254 (+) Transcript_13577:115-876(+)